MDVPDFPNLLALAVPFFIGAMLLEVIIGKVAGSARFETRDTAASLMMGAGNLASGIAFGFLGFAVLMALWPYRVLDLGFGWGAILFAIVIDDFRYYWYHRWAHESRWWWAFGHVTHHSSQHYNLSTALRQQWTGPFNGAFLLSVPAVLLGVHPVLLGVAGGVSLIYQYWIHTEVIRRFPWWIEAVMNTPSHHRVHHGRNPRYLDTNYAGIFIIWDRLFGTFVPELDEEPVRYGLVKNLGTFNPIRIAWHELASLVRDALQPRISLKARFMYVFGPPGWSHDGSRRTARALKEAFVRHHPEQAGTPGLPGRATTGLGAAAK